MNLTTLLDNLGYAESPHFLRRGTNQFLTAADFGHVFRKAANPECGLEGVYALGRGFDSPVVPVVYVCHVNSDNEAKNVHRLVWNQDVVPFVIVHSPEGVRLYNGFKYGKEKEGAENGVLSSLLDFNRVLDLIEQFSTTSIDSGRIWRERASSERRVDWHLLGALKRLDVHLQTKMRIKKGVSHALIGKYVYLRYLEDRGILSPRKLEGWGIDRSSVFGRTATRKGLASVDAKLNDWLNGCVFPLVLEGEEAPGDAVIGRVAGTFNGDQLVGEDSWQLALDFKVYDFSYIPIETLSVIYEQFLHTPGTDGVSRGKEAAAYYTPIPVVNFMLGELDQRYPLKPRMKVFDPACGSGAFLVQCYRKLIERTFPPTSPPPKPGQLRSLLEKNIYGMDSDPDACSVTELSLTLTLLDYVNPPDLEVKGRKPHLPSLRNQNIFHANFFDWNKHALERLRSCTFDWIVGNPPWKRINPNKLSEQDEPVWKWMNLKQNLRSHPCGNREASQAFTWRVSQLIDGNGIIALLLPAKTLFAEKNDVFRKAFFSTMYLECVANLSNLRHSLFSQGAVAPAAAIVFRKQRDDRIFDTVPVFSPLFLNQEGVAARSSNGAGSSWTLLINASEIRDLSVPAIASGDGLPWKIALWGSDHDVRLLRRVARKHKNLGWYEKQEMLILAEGPALKEKPVSQGEHKTRYEEDVVGKNTVEFDEMAYQRPLFVIPESAKQPDIRVHLDLRGSVRGMKVCRGPHIIISGTGQCACYESEYLVVPRRWFGIVSPTDDERFLRALALYLNSDFAYYTLFLTSAELGIERDRIAISKFRQLPIPLMSLSEADLQEWVDLHKTITGIPARCERTVPTRNGPRQKSLFGDEEPEGVRPVFDDLLHRLNALVYDALGLDTRERALVHDLVHVRLKANDGRLGSEAIATPTPIELRAYAECLKSDLDTFVEGVLSQRHRVDVVYDDLSAMVEISLLHNSNAADVLVVKAGADAARQLEKTRTRLRKEHSQWVYFDRNLRVFDGKRTCVFKPMQGVHWTISQAMTDATDIIAETIQSGDG